MAARRSGRRGPRHLGSGASEQAGGEEVLSQAAARTATDWAGHVDGQGFTGKLIDDRQALQLLAIGAGIKHEVVTPD